MNSRIIMRKGKENFWNGWFFSGIGFIPLFCPYMDPAEIILPLS
jgi:hypothetical protein